MDSEQPGPSNVSAAESNNARNMLEGVDSIQTYQSDDDVMRERKESINSNQSIRSYDSTGDICWFILYCYQLCSKFSSKIKSSILSGSGKFISE